MAPCIAQLYHCSGPVQVVDDKVGPRAEELLDCVGDAPRNLDGVVVTHSHDAALPSAGTAL